MSAPIVDGGIALDDSPFAVPRWLHLLGGIVDRSTRFWRWLAEVETVSLRDRINDLSINSPIYICGLPRSGTTLLHEIVASQPGVASHQMKDYPFLFTPYWWRRATENVRPGEPRQRAHGDGILVNGESPDALEEMLWTVFFPDCHNPAVSNVIGAESNYPEFEQFYRQHVRKLLFVTGATRFASKANYHVARLAYLLRMFPDAKILLAVRSPAEHVASLLRQQRRFARGQQAHPRALAFMQRTGHFEFGLDRRPVNLGDSQSVRRIMDDWSRGEEVRGLAAYWAMVYSYLASVLRSDARVRAAVLVVLYEKLCASPAETLTEVFRHCELPDCDGHMAQASAVVRAPTNTLDFSADELRVIEQCTGATAQWWMTKA